MVLQSYKLIFFHSFFVILVQPGSCKSVVRLGSYLLNDWESRLFVCLAVMVDLQEQEDVLACEVVFVVPPLGIVLVELEGVLWDDGSHKGDLASPVRLFPSFLAFLGDFPAQVVKGLVLSTSHCFSDPLPDSL